MKCLFYKYEYFSLMFRIYVKNVGYFIIYLEFQCWRYGDRWIFRGYQLVSLAYSVSFRVVRDFILKKKKQIVFLRIVFKFGIYVFTYIYMNKFFMYRYVCMYVYKNVFLRIVF